MCTSRDIPEITYAQSRHVACMLNTHIPVDENSLNTTLMLGRM